MGKKHKIKGPRAHRIQYEGTKEPIKYKKRPIKYNIKRVEKPQTQKK